MTVTKTQLADAYAAALNEMLADESDHQFSRRDANKFMDCELNRSTQHKL